MVQQNTRTGDEHAGVPAVVARGEIGSRGGGVGLLGEAEHPASIGGPGHIDALPAVDVAEGGGGAGRLDADGHHPSLARQRRGLADGIDEGSLIGDGVIGGEGPDDGVAAVALGDDSGGQGDGGHGVPRQGLGQNALARQLGQLIGHCRHVRDAGDDRRRGGHGRQARHRALDQGATGAGQVEEELGMVPPGQRPQPSARAAGGDDGVNRLIRSGSLGRLGALDSVGVVSLVGLVGTADAFRILIHSRRLSLIRAARRRPAESSRDAPSGRPPERRSGTAAARSGSREPRASRSWGARGHAPPRGAPPLSAVAD